MDFLAMRKAMVEEQIVKRGIRQKEVLDAMLNVPRDRFVSTDFMPYAYADGPLPIEDGQTISQPYIVALMAEAAELTNACTCLEIGTGSGYSAAILSRIAKKVYSIERFEVLAEKAKKRFQELHYSNIETIVGDGTKGWGEFSPYDAIIVTAGAPVIPQSLVKQLKPGGRLIIPVGDHLLQNLLRIRKLQDESLAEDVLEGVRFVPLVGDEGWKENTTK